MLKKIFLSFVSLSLGWQFFWPIINFHQTALKNKFCDKKQKSSSTKRIILNVRKNEQETDYYCFPAVLQETFQFFGINYSQTYIYQQLGGVAPSGINMSSNNNINWINHQLSAHNIIHQYHHVNIPMNFGSTNEERLLFENFVTSSLSQGVPIMLSTYHNLRRSYHATLIYGIESNSQNPLETTYHYHDPMTQFSRSFFVGAQLPTVIFGHGPGQALGVNTNFDFINHKIKIDIPEQKFSGYLQNKKIEQNQAINLTKTAGISNLKQLKAFKTIYLNAFNIKTKWLDQSYDRKSDAWQTKWFVVGQTKFKKLNHFSWSNKYRNVGRGEFTTYYGSATWQENDGSFYLNLTYQFFAQALLTTSLIYIYIFSGQKWTLTF